MDADVTRVDLSRYPRPSLAVDVAALTVLPSPSPRERRRLGVVVVLPDTPDGLGWRLPGAMVHAPAPWGGDGGDGGDGARPPLREAVDRALAKAGLAGREPQQLRVFDAPDRDDRGWVVSVAHADTLRRRSVPGEGLAEGRGTGHAVAVAVLEDDGELRAVLPGGQAGLPYDHAHVVQVAVTQLRDRYAADPDPGHLLGEEFALRDLRRVHEAVAGADLLPDTFRRHVGHGLVGLGRTTSGTVGRPAELFRRWAPGDPAKERTTPRPARSNAGRAARAAQP